jgi:hypothetical protein
MFEFYGLFGLVWFILWWIFVSDRPNECRGISDKEKEFIEDNIDEDENEVRIISNFFITFNLIYFKNLN